MAINSLKDSERTALNAAQTPDPEKFVPLADHTLALNRIKTFEADETKRLDCKIEDAVSKAIEDGKVAPASRDYHLAACRADGGLERFQAAMNMLNALVMMALGSFRFGVSKPEHKKLSRSTVYRWKAMERIGRAPALQFLGEGGDEITLEGTIYPQFKGGLKQVDGMRSMAGTGVPMMLVDGGGAVWKRWCITSVDDTKTYLFADGTPRRIDFSIHLAAYGGDVLW
ncbi:phage tail protein [Celeribacter sp.]|uniref:phage tail protein n=1 Tax=Celeribacter sp. TaxID=1890673 RepID=UPI003A8D92E5